MPGESRTSPRRILAVEKQRQALALRYGGATYDSIAQALHYASRQGAQMAVEAALRKTVQEPADQLRQLDLGRLDAMLLAIWAQARAGNFEAIDMALKILARRAKLLGLDAPVRQELTGADGGPIELAAVTLAQRLQRIIDAEEPASLPPGIENGTKPN